MYSIKFRDNIIIQYPDNILKEIPFFKGLIESCVEINDIIPFNEFDSDIINDFICNNETVNFSKYNFDDLFHAKEFLMLYNKPHIQTQFTNQLKKLLLNDINKINLDRLEIYIRNEDKYFLSNIVNRKPELTQLYPYVTSLKYINKNIDLTKFNNLIMLICQYNENIKTFRMFDNLKNLKILHCYNCINLEDGCFDIFINLEELMCDFCYKLKRPFNNLKNLKKLYCIGCINLEDGCFDALTNLEKLNCKQCDKLKRPFDNLKNLKKLHCGSFNLTNKFVGLENECFSKLTNLKELVCYDCVQFKQPFNNLEKLKKLRCYNCKSLVDDCFNMLKNLNFLVCHECGNKSFNVISKNIKRLDGDWL